MGQIGKRLQCENSRKSLQTHRKAKADAVGAAARGHPPSERCHCCILVGEFDAAPRPSSQGAQRRALVVGLEGGGLARRRGSQAFVETSVR
jgi:hypothetical protein